MQKIFCLIVRTTEGASAPHLEDHEYVLGSCGTIFQREQFKRFAKGQYSLGIVTTHNGDTAHPVDEWYTDDGGNRFFWTLSAAERERQLRTVKELLRLEPIKEAVNG